MSPPTMTPQPPKSRLRNVDAHIDRVRACERSWRGHRLPTATPDGERYPLIYPRDTAVIASAIERLEALGAAAAEEVSASIAGAARFLVAAGRDDGQWGQRYDLDLRDRSIYPQEDNTAHAVAVVARHVLRERRRGAPSPVEGDALEAVTRGVAAARGLWREEPGLIASNTSIHESAIERGFTLWTNGAYVDALRLAADAFDSAHRGEDAGECRAFRDVLLDGIERHLVRDGSFVRRLTLDRETDWRPDITLLAPHRFGFASVAPDAEAAGVARLEDGLWNQDVGLLERYPSDRDDVAIHLHGGNGPYVSFSNWLAQRHAAHGNESRAHEILDLILDCATPDGDLPEHVATVDAFREFVEREYLTGLDFRKELNDDILLDGVSTRDKLEEAARMAAAYAHAARTADEAGDGVIRLAAPHAWAHVETAVTIATLDAARD